MLDAPAGGGQIVEAAQIIGNDVVGADINFDRPDFVYADLNQPLPFLDEQFRIVTSLEGIEHVVYQKHLLKEFVRVLESGGYLIITTPNTAI